MPAGLPFILWGGGIAALIALFARGRTAHRASMIVLALTALGEAFFAAQALIQGAVFGPTTFSAVFALILNVVACPVALYAVAYGERYRDTYHLPSLDVLTIVFVVGMQGVVLSPTPLVFLLFWEAMSVASFFLVMADGREESQRAALFYLIMTQLGAGALMAGFALLSGGNINASLNQIAGLALVVPERRLLLAFILLFFGFGSKAGLWPFHVWLPLAHPQAPSHVSALMSGVMLKMALYGFLVSLSLFPSMPAAWGTVVIVIGMVTAVYGVLYAVVDRDMKRTLAYSSMENMGLMFVMLGVAIRAQAIDRIELLTAAFSAVMVHAAAHALFKAGLFMGAGTVIATLHDRSLEKMGGLAKRMPRFSMAMLVLSLGAAALPPSGAFAAEWLLMQQIVSALPTLPRVEQGILIAVLAGVAFVGGLAVFAMVKFFGIAFLGQPRSTHAAEATEPPVGLSWPVWLAAAATIGFGLFVPSMLRLLAGVAGRAHAQNGLMISGNGSWSPLFFASVGLAVVLAVYGVRRLLSTPAHERSYHAWDCGQPITAGMEYTAIAFSAPIRFFFRTLLRRTKIVTVEPLVATNPWIARRTFSMEIRRIWYDWLYVPVIKSALFASTWVRRLQNGVIQFYIALIALALVVTVAVAL